MKSSHLYKIFAWLPVFMLLSAAVQARHLPEFTDLVKDTSPSVVNISTTQKVRTGMPELPEGFQVPEFPEGSPFGDLFKYFLDRDGGDPSTRDAESLGSGFIISDDGYILTNYHVVKGADEIIVRLSDRRELKAEIIGEDKRSDVALLKIDASDLPVARIGKSGDLEVGEWVLAIGSPFGFDHSATAGIVSAKGRSLPRENYVPFIQTDVAINPGNSGGPLFNQEGEVVGVNSQIYSRTGGYMGLSFAIPIEVAMDVAEQLKTSGRVSRGWLGVLIQDVTLDLAESFGMDKPRGALVAKVLPDSPAEDAGMKVGDIIVRFDGKDVISSASLPPIVGSSKLGAKLPVDIIRNSDRKQVKVKLGELPDDTIKTRASKPAEATTNRLGLTVGELADEMRNELEIDHGVVVERIVNGAALDAGIRKGDIIVSIGDKPVKDPDQFQSIVEDLAAGQSVAMLVQRGTSPTFMALKVPGS